MRSVKLLVLLIISALFQTIACASAGNRYGSVNSSSQTYYVSPGGSNTNSGTEGNPWASIAFACSSGKLRPGDELRISAGTYVENTTIRIPCGVNIIGAGIDKTIIQGSPDTLMLVRDCQNLAAPQHIQDFKLDGQNKSAGRIGLYAIGVSGVYIHDLFVEKFKGIDIIGSGIALSYATNSRIYDCILKHNGTSGPGSCGGNLGFGELDKCEIYNIDIEDDVAYAIKGSVNVRNSIRNSKIFNINAQVTSNNCSRWGNLAMELFWVDHYNNEIFNCRFNNVLSLIPGLNLSTGKTVRVHHNHFQIPNGPNAYSIEADTRNMEVDHNYFEGGLYTMALSSGRPGVNGYLVHHNVFDDQVGPTAILHIVPGTNGSKFYNNTVVLRRKFQNGAFYLMDGSDVDIRNNLFTSTVPDFGQIGVTANSTFGTNLFQNIIPRGNNALNADPLLPLAGNFPEKYVPSAASPVRDAGVLIPGITDGFSGSAPDIGAFEIGGSTWKVGPQPTLPAIASLFASRLSGYAPLTVQFDGSYSLGEGLTYHWDFGNGQTQTGSKPSMQFTQQGYYTVTLTITDAGGVVSSQSVNINVFSRTEATGLTYSYYEGTWSLIPDFSALTPLKTGLALDFNHTERLRDINFGMRYEGKIRIATAGTYTFFTNSDDGSNLYVNNQKVVDNDGLHVARERQGTITLAAGDYPFVVDFIQGGGGSQLVVSYEGPGIPKQAIPLTVLFTTPPSLAPVANAGPDVTIYRPQHTVELRGSGNPTAGRTIVSYQWIKVSGKGGTLVNAGTATLTAKNLPPDIYEFELTVTDDEGETASDAVKVIVLPAGPTCTASGTLLREVWINLPGTSISTIPVNTIPFFSTQVSRFEGPVNAGDNFGARYRGYICAPETGEYVFWISSDDASELYLSTDKEPANRVRIAGVTTAVSSRNNWFAYPEQQSVRIKLRAGKQYYVEVLHKEGTGADHLAVAWRRPSMNAAANPEIIPGSVLSPVPSQTPEPDPSACIASGALLREVWNDLPGTSVSVIPLDTPPSASSLITSFEGPVNAAENFGARYRGYICVPQSGYYTFWLSSDDGGALYLSTDDNPANKRKIGEVATFVRVRNNWFEFASQQSENIPLLAGQRYYIEALHKEGIGGDHLAVAWRTPLMGSTDAPVIIPGSALSPPDEPGLAKGRIASAENSAEHIFSAYPNPGNGQIIRMTTGSATVSHVRVTTLTGVTMPLKEIRVTPGELLVIPLSTLASGTYLLNVRTDQGPVTKRVVVLHTH